MTTIDDLRQRIETQYVEPVVEETPTVPILYDIDDSQTTFRTMSGVFSPDDESLISPGRIVELDYELVRVLSYDASTKEVTCRRGVRGTEAASHTAAATEMRFPTRWPRDLIKTSIENALDSLWQPLFVVDEMQATVSSADYLQFPLSTVRILRVEYRNDVGEWDPLSYRFFPKHPLDPAYAFAQVGDVPHRALCTVTYGMRIEAPATVIAEIENFPPAWARIVVAEVASDLLAGVDIDAVTQEYLTQQLRLERFPVKSGSSISQNLIRFREYLVDQARKDIDAAYPKGVHRKKVSLY